MYLKVDGKRIRLPWWCNIIAVPIVFAVYVLLFLLMAAIMVLLGLVFVVASPLLLTAYIVAYRTRQKAAIQRTYDRIVDLLNKLG